MCSGVAVRIGRCVVGDEAWRNVIGDGKSCREEVGAEDGDLRETMGSSFEKEETVGKDRRTIGRGLSWKILEPPSG